MDLLDKSVLEKKRDTLTTILEKVPETITSSSRCHKVRKSLALLERRANRTLETLEDNNSEVQSYLEEILELIEHTRLALWYFQV